VFELETLTKARLADIVVLSQKNRQPDENPGAKLTFTAELSNDVLSYFDGALKSMLFTRGPAAVPSPQGTLEGVPVVSDMPNLTRIGAKVGKLHWIQEMTGYELQIDQGIGGPKSDLVVTGCTLSNFWLLGKDGGTVSMKLDCESADVAEGTFGKLAKLKSREVEIRLIGPSEHTLDEAGTGVEKWPFPKGSKGKAAKVQEIKPKAPDATEAFIATEGAPAAP